MNFLYLCHFFIFALSVHAGSAETLYKTMPYRFPMEIGETYDQGATGSLVQLYRPNAYTFVSVMKQEVDLRSFGKDESSEDYLMAGGHIGLDVEAKAVGVGVDVSGEYSRLDSSGESLGEWIGKVDVTIGKKMILNPKAHMRADCANLPKALLGTHYIRSVSYGRNLDVKVKTQTTSNARSQTIDASIDVSVTVKGITPAVGASIEYENTKKKSFIKTDISFTADGALPFLLVDILDAGEFVNEWTTINAKTSYPKQIELAVYDIKALCKPEPINTTKIPDAYVSPGDEVTLQVYKIVERHIMDYKNADSRIAAFVKAVDFQKMTPAAIAFLGGVYRIRWDVTLIDYNYRLYINKHINVEEREKEGAALLKDAENAYRKDLDYGDASWETRVRKLFENNIEDAAVFCPKHYFYFNGGCYFVSNIKATKKAARTYCESGASELLEIRYLDEFNFIVDYLKEQTKGDPTTTSKTFMVDAQLDEQRIFKWNSGRHVNLDYVEEYVDPLSTKTNRAFSLFSCIIFKFQAGQWKLYPDFCRYFPTHYFICHRLFF